MAKPKSNPANLVVNEHFVAMISDVLKFFKGDIKKARAWIVTPNLHLGGLAPLKLFMMGKGDKVMSFIENAAEEGGWAPREWTLKRYESVGAPEVIGPQLMELETVRVREIPDESGI